MKVKDLIDHITQSYAMDEEVAYVIFSRDDAQLYAEDMGILLSDEDADSILSDIDRHVDLEIGLGWMNLDVGIREWKEKKGK